MAHNIDVIAKVRRALGRGTLANAVPAPPAIDPRITRVVASNADVLAAFFKSADTMHIHASEVTREQLPARLVEFLKQHNCRKVALPDSFLTADLHLQQTIQSSSIEARSWIDMTLDELYDGYDCAVTDVTYVVAETGTLVIKPSAGHGRALSLVPMIHVAIVQKDQILPDLVDLFEKLAADPDRSNYILISGPSKTADIEMNVVTGVHGPNVVEVFVLK